LLIYRFDYARYRLFGSKSNNVGENAEYDRPGISRAPVMAAGKKSMPCWRCSKMFSPTTMASSTTIPGATKKATKEIVLILTPMIGGESEAADKRNGHARHHLERQPVCQV